MFDEQDGAARDSVMVTVNDVGAPTVDVTAPAGETLAIGVAQTVQWTAFDDILLTGFDVSVSLDGGLSYAALPGCTGLAGTARSCAWTVPSPATSQGRVRVVARDGAGHTGEGLGAFSSVEPALAVTRPNAPSTWDAGTVESITWMHNLGAGVPFDVELSRDGGSTWRLLAHVPADSATLGSYAWTVSGPSTAQARIRVTHAGAWIVQDQSDTDFAIRAAPTAAFRVRDIAPGPASSLPSGLTTVGDAVYFAANDAISGSELWKTDGTEAGTVRVKDIFPGGGSSMPSDLRAAGGLLYFTASRADTGSELWKSDGTEAGTTLVSDIAPGFQTSSVAGVTAFAGVIYFRACATSSDCELWRSDGTPAGTTLVKDINPSGSSNPGQFVELNGILLFTAYDGTSHGPVAHRRHRRGDVPRQLRRAVPDPVRATGLTRLLPGQRFRERLRAVGDRRHVGGNGPVQGHLSGRQLVFAYAPHRRRQPVVLHRDHRRASGQRAVRE